MRYYNQLSNGNCIELDHVSEQELSRVEKTFTFKLVLNGFQSFSTGSRKLMLYPDSFIILGPATSYQATILSDLPVQTLSIRLSGGFVETYGECLLSQAYLNNGLPSLSVYPLKGDMRFNVKNLVTRIMDKAQDEELLNEYLKHFLFNYQKLHQQEFYEKLEKLEFVRDTTKWEIFRRLAMAKEFISTNYDKRFSLEDLAAFSCLSVNHLLRTFKQAYGISPYQYLTLVRVNRARIYLESGEFSVNEIVMLVGFESVSSFIRLFKTTFQFTPLKFKKQFARA